VLLVPGTARVAYATMPEDEPRLEIWDEFEAEVIWAAQRSVRRMC
jgi:hypothetical protein